jgi:hypothetical protein
MADYPQLSKTWQFNVNQLLVETTSNLTDARFLLWALIDSLLGFVSNPWTILSSNNMVNATVTSGSNGVNLSSFTGSGVMDVTTTSGAPATGSILVPALKAIVSYTGTSGGNQFTGCTTTYGSGVLATGQVAHTAPVWAAGGTAHSWIVLGQTGISTTFQLLIACSVGSNYELNVSFSPLLGFSGGTTTADPTAYDAVPILPASYWGNNPNNTYQYRLHVMQSTDGACTRVLICDYDGVGIGGTCCGYMSIELAENPVPGWTYPIHATWIATAGNTSALTYNSLFQTYNAVSRATANFTMIWTAESTNGTHLASMYLAPNDLSGEWMCMPIGLWSNTIGSKGRHGSLYDMWWGPGGSIGASNFEPTSLLYGANGNTFAQIGCVVVPWPNATPPQLA